MGCRSSNNVDTQEQTNSNAVIPTTLTPTQQQDTIESTQNTRKMSSGYYCKAKFRVYISVNIILIFFSHIKCAYYLSS